LASLVHLVPLEIVVSLEISVWEVPQVSWVSVGRRVCEEKKEKMVRWVSKVSRVFPGAWDLLERMVDSVKRVVLAQSVSVVPMERWVKAVFVDHQEKLARLVPSGFADRLEKKDLKDPSVWRVLKEMLVLKALRATLDLQVPVESPDKKA